MIRFKVERKKSVTMTVVPRDSMRMNVEKAAAVGLAGNTYNESYTIVPEVEEQRMRTKDKFMKDDVVITAIPFFEVSNNSGGNTVYIGSEVQRNGSF